MLEFIPLETGRGLAAILLLLSYLCGCAYLYRRSKLGRHMGRNDHAGSDAAPICIVYASQSGQAATIAQQTAHMLARSQRNVHLYRIEENWQAYASTAYRVLWVISTHGAGSAPDHAIPFAHGAMCKPDPTLQGMRYGLLALGDRNYPTFCRFARQLDTWLQTQGALPAFPRIEVDRLDPAALMQWQESLNELGAEHSNAHAFIQPYAPWRFISRQRLNPGSESPAIDLIVLQAQAATATDWQAGDLVDVLIPEGDGQARTYSIANLAGKGQIELIVRKQQRPDGQLGVASGWLCEKAQANDVLSLRIRSNPNFHLKQDLSKPIILIGTGAGIAGLRAHLQAKEKAILATTQAAPARSAWLFFGERTRRHDYLCQAEIEKWQSTGVLSRLDLSFSRDEHTQPYVQHKMLAQAETLREWLAHGAQIIICGNAKKMAPDVDTALRQILGDTQLAQLQTSGRIRRDVF